MKAIKVVSDFQNVETPDASQMQPFQRDVMHAIINDLRASLGTRFFSCTFIKNDGTISKRVFRLGVRTWKDDEGNLQSLVGVPYKKNVNVIKAFSIRDKGWRTITIRRIIELRQGNFNYVNHNLKQQQ